MELIHSFDADGYYTGSAERPWDPVREAVAVINGKVATLDPVPAFDPQTQRARRVDGAWTVEQIPQPEQKPEPDAETPASFKVLTCTPAQGLVALFVLKNLTESDVLAAIDQIEEPVQQYTARIGYQRATTWERGSPTVQAMTQLLLLSEQDLDDLFSYAVGVKV